MGKLQRLVIAMANKGDDEGLRSILGLKELLTENLEILYTPFPDVLEEIVRVLTRADMQYKILEGTFTLVDYPLNFNKLLVTTFAYLESVSPTGRFPLPDELVYMLQQAEESVPDLPEGFYKGWKCGYEEVRVVYKYVNETPDLGDGQVFLSQT